MQTYPLIGNYGIIREDFEGSLLREGLCGPGVLRRTLQLPLTDCDLDTYLKEQGVPGLCGVDTRELTRIIREHGVMNAAICDEIPADLTPMQDLRRHRRGGGCYLHGARRVYPAEGEERFRVALHGLRRQAQHRPGAPEAGLHR